MGKRWMAILAGIVLLVALELPVGLAMEEKNTADAGVVIQNRAENLPVEVLVNIENTVKETLRLFDEEANMGLQEPLTLVLVKGHDALIRQAAVEFHVTEEAAAAAARGVDALAAGGAIVLDVTAVPTLRQQTFLVAHEMTHRFQYQAGGRGTARIYWLMEGTAEAVGAKVVERRGFFTVTAYRQNWQENLKLMPKTPPLDELKDRVGWSRSMMVYGGTPVYKTAGLGAFVLMDQHGLSGVMSYFQAVGNGDTAADAFFRAFGVTLEEFVFGRGKLISGIWMQKKEKLFVA